MLDHLKTFGIGLIAVVISALLGFLFITFSTIFKQLIVTLLIIGFIYILGCIIRVLFGDYERYYD